MNKYKLFIFLFFMLSLIIFADEKAEESKSLEEERLETIRYGIDSQVMDLIKNLVIEKNYEFNKDLVKLLESSTNSRLDESIISLLDNSEDDSAVEYIFNKLQEDYNLRDNIRVVYINYISKYQTLEISEYFLELIEEESNSVSIASIKALGKSELEHIIPTLIDYLEDSLFDSLRKPAIIESLGKLKAYEALEILTDIATDIYSDDKSLRWRSVVALGEIGSPESLPILKSLFSDEDPNLRNYTISALKNFPSKEVEKLLIQGLKDSYWKVRVQAAESLGELGSKEAIGILIYKSENDPDIRNVRSSALNALGDIGGSEAFEHLRKMYQNERTDISLRYIAIQILAEKDLSNSLKIIDKVIKDEWDKDKSFILDYTCKILSSTKNSSLKETYLKMLSYESTYNLKLYALRGIKLNSLASLKQEVEKLTSEDTPATVKKLAIDVMKSF